MKPAYDVRWHSSTYEIQWWPFRLYRLTQTEATNHTDGSVSYGASYVQLFPW